MRYEKIAQCFHGSFLLTLTRTIIHLYEYLYGISLANLNCVCVAPQEYLSKSAQRDALRGEVEVVEGQVRAAREQLQRAGLAQAAHNERLQAFEKQLAEQRLECQEARKVSCIIYVSWLLIEY